jgi:hypothetical protein
MKFYAQNLDSQCFCLQNHANDSECQLHPSESEVRAWWPWPK